MKIANTNCSVDMSIAGIGRNGHSPYIDETTHTWFVFDDVARKYIDTKVSAICTTDSKIKTKYGTVISQNGNYAEIGKWSDNNVFDEYRIGYFVTIDDSESGITITKATSTKAVRGVTVSAPAFSGNASSDKFDDDENLLKPYEFVAVMGLVSVIDNGTCIVNDRCMPSDDGTAIPSSNNIGYQIVDRIDETHILIALEPGTDMIQRIKNDLLKLSEEKADKSDIPFDRIDNNTLEIKNKTLCIKTTDDAEEDNTRPITSSGVHVIVGNIDTLLSQI